MVDGRAEAAGGELGTSSCAVCRARLPQVLSPFDGRTDPAVQPLSGQVRLRAIEVPGRGMTGDLPAGVLPQPDRHRGSVRPEQGVVGDDAALMGVEGAFEEAVERVGWREVDASDDGEGDKGRGAGSDTGRDETLEALAP